VSDYVTALAALWVEHLLHKRPIVRSPGQVKSKTEKLTPVASLVSVHHLRAGAGLVSVSDWMGHHVYLRHGTSVCWQINIRF